MAPTNAPETLRKALAMGAHRGVHVTDPALGGLVRGLDRDGPRGGAARRSSSTWSSPASTRPTASAAIVPAAVAAHLGLAVPVVRRPDRARHGDADRPRPAHQRDRLRPARGAAARSSSAGPRRSASRATRRSRGSWPRAARRSSRARWPTSGWTRATVGGAVATTAVLDSRMPPARGATEIVRGTPDEGAARIVDFLVERRII